MGKIEKPDTASAIEEAHAEEDAAREHTSAVVDDLQDMAATVLERLRKRQQKAGPRLVKVAK